ncbi:MAG: hypothetical protein U9R68_06155, partial [Planctomycetota bacterium]|nr:hypothetical protein [Planctomycetota bacterium]
MPDDSDQSDASFAVAEAEGQPQPDGPPPAARAETGGQHPQRMGDRLVELGILTQAQLEECLELQKSSLGERLDQILVRKDYASEDDVMSCLAAEYGLEFVHVSQLEIPERVRDLLPLEFCRQHKVLVIDADREADAATIATADPANIFLLDEVRRRLGCRVRLAVSTVSEISRALDELSVGTEDFQLDNLIQDIADDSVEIVDEGEDEVADLAKVAGESPVVRLVNYLICNAVKQG